MPFSPGKAQCNLLISAELCSLFILGMYNPHETPSTSACNALKILSPSVCLSVLWLWPWPLCQPSSPPNYFTNYTNLWAGAGKWWLAQMVFSPLFEILSVFGILVSIWCSCSGGHSQILPEHPCGTWRDVGIARGAFREPKLCPVGAVLSIKYWEIGDRSYYKVNILLHVNISSCISYFLNAPLGSCDNV